MSTSSTRYVVFVRSLLRATPTTTTASSAVTPLTLFARDSSPVVIGRGSQRIAVPKFILRDVAFQDNIAVLELQFDQILRFSYKTKGLKGYEGTIVHIPLKYWPSMCPYVFSVEFDTPKGFHPFIGVISLLIIAITVVSVSPLPQKWLPHHAPPPPSLSAHRGNHVPYLPSGGILVGKRRRGNRIILIFFRNSDLNEGIRV
ncbi:hypothetical protein EDD18DRAFT_1110540 [Armillaria luteobubalina]|uniref:Uncharacterized protein n=1 Tax=Armillaria luteobubalina TaxID=153913 RepID=A0AA39PRY2_9AGAR|nr:hypothetical protein EDD18DRAFT_1110523 [Armillaria luteobubalina]KAK0488174.1 hypothetical protein EDD18DRAFT_1110540 [Armillaria luteobubalina]